MEKNYQSKEVILTNDLQVIPNIYALEKLGAGHDGLVFRFGNKALKLLKYDIIKRKTSGLMTFQKAVYFKDELNLKRILKPVDIMLDVDGSYTGYVMDYQEDIASEKKKGTPIYKAPGDFTCGDLIQATYDLSDDFSEMTKKKVVAKDLNRGSYVYSYDFMHLCDMDKYEYEFTSSVIDDLNRKNLNFVIVKHLYYEMLKLDDFDKEQLKKLSTWVKKSSNSRTFVRDLEQEINCDYAVPIKEYAKYKAKKICSK